MTYFQGKSLRETLGKTAEHFLNDGQMSSKEL